MQPILALTVARSVAGILSSLTNSAKPQRPTHIQAPVARGPFAKAQKSAGGFDQQLRSELGRRNPIGAPLLSVPGAQPNAPVRGAENFTAEAVKKMESMGVRLTQAQYDRLMEGVREAASRGGRKSLVMMDGLAFTVDTRAGKVLDVSERNRLDINVHTQIDSVVETRI